MRAFKTRTNISYRITFSPKKIMLPYPIYIPESYIKSLIVQQNISSHLIYPILLEERSPRLKYNLTTINI